MLEGLPLQVVSLEQVGITATVEETGKTFEENAVLKAQGYAEAAGLLTLADDSGLEVDALGGRPGVMSARYGGDHLSEQDQGRLLLSELNEVEWERRTARFRCVIAVTVPGGEARTVEGVIEGVIQYKAQGANGFGYDPVFYLPEKGCTTAQLSTEEKNRLSHRGQAARRARKLLETAFTE